MIFIIVGWVFKKGIIEKTMWQGNREIGAPL